MNEVSKGKVEREGAQVFLTGREHFSLAPLSGAGIASGRAPRHHDQRAVSGDPARGPRGRRGLRLPGHQQRGHGGERGGRAQREM